MRASMLALSATLLFAGCFTVDQARLKNGGEHVVVSNYGWKLFNCIPIFCGNANEHAGVGISFFRDDVTFDKIQSRFAKVSDGREIVCPVYDVNDTIFISIPFINVPVPIPYLWTYRKISLSGTVQ